MARTVRSEVARVVASDLCSGCGLCVLLDRGLDMQLDTDGYQRPTAVGDRDEIDGAVRLFRRTCPGRRVEAVAPRGMTRHPLLGPYLELWDTWAADPEVRHRASSGGALTALHTWLLASGTVAAIQGAAVDPARPLRTVPVRITTREEALGAAGSRYAPVSVAGSATFSASMALTGKPCEVAAVRALARENRAEAPILLSFFCAGTPSQHATERLVRDLGEPNPDAVTELWYRGRGWPGRFTARVGAREVSTDYEQSWGAVLGRATQWRCKVCPDGVGESADISAADSWEAGEDGYPSFENADGHSALIARTERGRAIVRAAAAAGVIVLRPLDPEKLVRAQPLQVSRRSLLAARMLGSIAAGRAVPRYAGFGLSRLSWARPREAIRAARGTWRRVRDLRRASSPRSR